MSAAATNHEIRRTLTRRAADPAWTRRGPSADARPFTVIGAYDREHPDFDGTAWRKLVLAASPEDARCEAVAEASGVDPDVTGDAEWMDRMDRTYALAVIAGHHPATLEDPGTGEFTRQVN